MDTNGALAQYSFNSYYGTDAWRLLSIHIRPF
jgi:hypothetical protein